MNGYPITSGKRLIKALLKEGYKIHKGRKGKLGKGSHISLLNPSDKQNVTIIKNTSNDLTKGLMAAIRRQLNISREEFIRILNNS